MRIARIAHLAPAAAALLAVSPELLEELYVVLEEQVGRDLAVGVNVLRLSVDGRAVRVNAFVDTDGTLWIEQAAAG